MYWSEQNLSKLQYCLDHGCACDVNLLCDVFQTSRDEVLRGTRILAQLKRFREAQPAGRPYPESRFVLDPAPRGRSRERGA